MPAPHVPQQFDQVSIRLGTMPNDIAASDTSTTPEPIKCADWLASSLPASAPEPNVNPYTGAIAANA